MLRQNEKMVKNELYRYLGSAKSRIVKKVI